ALASEGTSCYSAIQVTARSPRAPRGTAGKRSQERGTDVNQKELEDAKAIIAESDAADAAATVTDADRKSVEDKLLSFAHGLGDGERKHLFSMLDHGHGQDQGADVQGYGWWESWRARYWRRWRWSHGRYGRY